ncbi:unnamed protein product [Prorocentrum cordatum]|uniref:Tudor domain-containing protein n=1 Tax=Prorocentrum cordatum TaxID=2364126 RepID=A0ABN9TTM8_9DINO|nr:unnamed protein product [Polarella glacialis]
MRRECTVVQVDMNSVRVHYEGFDSSRDEWLPKDSNRIVANQQQQVQNQGQAVPSPPQSPHSMQQPGQGVGMPGQQLAAQPAGPEFLVGSKITVLSPSGMRRECTVVQVDMNRVRVHYEGFDSSRDEWLPKDSNRIVANQQQQVQNQGQAVPSPPQSPHSMQQPGQGVGMPGQQLAAQPAGPEFLVGSKVTVLSPSGMRRECTVVQVDMNRVRVHYEGFDSSRDEWLPKDSNRIVSDQQSMQPQGQAAPSPPQSLQPMQQPGQGVGAPGQQLAAQPTGPEFLVGSRITVLSPSGMRRECTVVQVDMNSVRVHYEGFDSSRDEWLPKDSNRIVANQQQQVQNQGQAVPSPPQSPHSMQQPGQGVGMPGQQLAAQPAGPEFLVGSKITVLSPSGMRRECTVVQVDMNRVRVHYEGFDSSRDEWLPKDSNRIVANQQQQVQNQGQAVPSPPQSPHSMQQPGQGVGMPGQQLAAQPAGPEFLVGSKITVLSPSGMRRECTVVQVDMHSVRIHYEGFDSSRDEWLPKDSNRIVVNQQSTQPQGQAVHSPPQSPQPMQQPGHGLGTSGQQLTAQFPKPEFLPGSKITVLSPSGMRRDCTVVQVDLDRVKIHYEGFDSSRDEWLPKDSNRIVANQQQQVQNQGQAVSSPPQSPQPMQQPGQGVGMPGAAAGSAARRT